jgi:YegS/Rv2252/BmrU family lipid kinase
VKTCFIQNPRSGRALRALAGVREFAARRGMCVALTERPRHAPDLVRAALAEGCDLVVAVGGDGTMNEVASALVGTSATLGLVPCGSGDGLGRSLGLHGSFARALHILETGRPRVIDTGLADGHPFFNIAGVGFEALLAERYNRLKKRGFLRYLATSTWAFRQRKAERCEIITAGRRTVFDALTLAVANSEQYGNNARIAPGARVDDGQLDLCAVPALTLLNAGPLAARMFTGSLNGNAGVLHERGTRFVIERPEPGLLHTDGEVHEAGRVIEFSIRPASLRIMCPA